MATSEPAKQVGALAGVRICDFTGQLAGAGATKFLAAFGAEVIRIEDPVRQGRWDILRGTGPYVDERRGVEFGGGFNNHNVEKLGITINLKTERGKELLRQIIAKSDAVTENFAAGVLDRWGFSYEEMRKIKSDIIYVSNCGFGHKGPYAQYKTWGPVVQAVSGLTFSSALPDKPPAGWGYSYMDHTGAYYMAIAILLAILHQRRTGEGQWVDLACTEAALSLNGPALLDWSVNGRPLRRDGQPHSNRNTQPLMVPHGIYACAGDDHWAAIACRDEDDWRRLSGLIGGKLASDPRFATLQARAANEDALDAEIAAWTSTQNKYEVQRGLRAANVPCSAVQKPQERIDHDADTAHLWPTVTHTLMGQVRVDGIPARFSATPWSIQRGAPCLGEHNDDVFTRLLGLSSGDIADLRKEGVI
jgi:crotonobetainyl-CoA:carnitine CoA-transferase CaiB-like acyl-CoA transferase